MQIQQIKFSQGNKFYYDFVGCSVEKSLSIYLVMIRVQCVKG